MAERKLLKKLVSKPVIDGAFVAIVFAMGFFLHWKIYEIALFALFIWIILNPILSRYLAFGAIFFLILTPLFLIGGKKIIADQLAIFAYYFLIMAVMMGIYELWKDKPESSGAINNFNDKINE
ncbi:MAG TPA: hypothetical protein P5262_04325 [Candidatus Moranbacteria bacterium]|nr:hypothetical protein [Candidatus Moranbacteria bacterium]